MRVRQSLPGFERAVHGSIRSFPRGCALAKTRRHLHATDRLCQSITALPPHGLDPLGEPAVFRRAWGICWQSTCLRGIPFLVFRPRLTLRRLAASVVLTAVFPGSLLALDLAVTARLSWSLGPWLLVHPTGREALGYLVQARGIHFPTDIAFCIVVGAIGLAAASLLPLPLMRRRKLSDPHRAVPKIPPIEIHSADSPAQIHSACANP